MKKMTIVFGIFAILLSDVMTAVVAYHYCNLVWWNKTQYTSFPPYAAMAYAIHFVAAIVICIFLSILFYKKSLLQNKITNG